jgi:HK97 family phage portal protein
MITQVREKINDWLGKSDRVSASRVSGVALDIVPKQIDPTFDLLVRQNSPNTATACRIITDAIASLPFRVMERVVEDGKERLEDAEGHDLAVVLARPNPFHTQREVIRLVVEGLILNGNAYVSIEGGKKAKRELWPQESDLVSINVDKTGKPSGYAYTKDGKLTKRWDIEEMIHVRRLSAANMREVGRYYYGASFVQPHLNLLEQEWRTDRHNVNYLKKGATASHIIFLKQNGVNQEELDKVQKKIKSDFSGDENPGKLMLFGGEGTGYPLSHSPKDMDFRSMSEHVREKLLASMGVPPSLAGVFNYGNYANVVAQLRIFYEGTISPILMLIEDSFTDRLLPNDTDYVFKFDLSGVKALREDEKTEADMYAVLVNSGIITPNEARERMWSLANIDGGYSLKQSVSPFSTFEDGTGGEEAPDDDTKPQGDESADEKKGAKRRRKVMSPDGPKPRSIKISAPPKFTKTGRPLEHRANFADVQAVPIEKVFRKFLSGQLSRTLDGLDTFSKGSSNRLVVFKASDDDLDPKDIDSIFDRSHENEMIKDAMTPPMRSAIYNAGNDAIEEVGINMVFDLRNEHVRDEVKKFQNRLKNINDFTYERIKQALLQGYENGDSIQDIKRSLRNDFAFSSDRAARVARTESGGYVNGGAIAGWKQVTDELGTTIRKEWIATFDSVTREAHSAANGQIVGLDESFTVGGEQLQYAGDPSGDAANIINCRCTVGPVAD